MIQLKICSGKMAGTVQVVRHFPFRIGRAATSDLRIEEDGVWEKHLELDFAPADGFVLRAQSGALVAVNDQAIEQAVLRNGDSIQVGALKISFWLGETRQAALQIREWFTWGILLATSAVQVALIYWLLQ